jgi:hypothetical protein
VATTDQLTDRVASPDPLVAAIAARLPDVRLLADEVDRESYRYDETAYLRAGLPRAVALPTTTADVVELVRIAREFRVPIVPRGAGTGLSGGAAGIEGCLTIAFTAMDRIIEIDRENLVAVVQPGIINAKLKAAVAEEACSTPRPGELRDVLDRWQPRHERRRPVLRQVRPDARLGAVARGGDGRRRGHPDRRPERQGRRRLLAHPPVRRQPGHARDHHRGDAQLRPAPPPRSTMLAFFRRSKAAVRRSPGSPPPACRRSRSSSWTGSRSRPSTT